VRKNEIFQKNSFVLNILIFLYLEIFAIFVIKLSNEFLGHFILEIKSDIISIQLLSFFVFNVFITIIKFQICI